MRCIIGGKASLFSLRGPGAISEQEVESAPVALLQDLVRCDSNLVAEAVSKVINFFFRSFFWHQVLWQIEIVFWHCKRKQGKHSSNSWGLFALMSQQSHLFMSINSVCTKVISIGFVNHSKLISISHDCGSICNLVPLTALSLSILSSKSCGPWQSIGTKKC